MGRVPPWGVSTSPLGDPGHEGGGELESNPDCCASENPFGGVAPLADVRGLPEARVSGVPAAVSGGAGVGLPERPREGRGFAGVCDFGGRAMPANMGPQPEMLKRSMDGRDRRRSVEQ